MARQQQQPQNRNQEASGVALIAQNKIALKRDLLPKALPEIRDVLPHGMDPQRFIAMAYLAVAGDPTQKLPLCDGTSIVRATVAAAVCGLEIGGLLGHGYLVPFNNSATFMPGYKGLLYLGVEGGGIKSGRSRLVYEGEVFDVDEGSNPRIIHKPRYDIDRSPERITYAYFVGVLPDGSTQFKVLPRAEIERRRNVSRMKDGDTWTKWYDEMSAKTATRAGMKEVPMSFRRLGAALEFDQRVDTGTPSAVVSGYDDAMAEMVRATEASQAEAESLREQLRVRTEEARQRVAEEKASAGTTTSAPEPATVGSQEPQGSRKSPEREPGQDDDDPPPLTSAERQAQVRASASQALGGKQASLLDPPMQ